MALKHLKIRLATPAELEKPTDIPVVKIEGTDIKSYNDADKASKDAEGTMKKFRPDIMEIALTEIYTRSCKRPQAPLTSVKLMDDSGEVITVSSCNSYKEVGDVDSCETLFDDHDLDINEYVTEGIKATFDDSVFYDAEGNFQQEIYDDVRKAIQTIVTKRQLPKNPLNTAKVVKVKEKFHDDRYVVFPKVETQLKVFEIMPNTVRLAPQRPKEPKADKK